MPRIRPCAACGQKDDHPRHVIAMTPTESLFFHMDCHANNDCPTCKQQIADAKGAQGDKLRRHLIALGETTNG